MKDIEQKICEFGESIVSYMYDEMSAIDRERFEDHLLNCSPCTDEFAAVADARYGVYEWNKKEFAHIQTPHFVIPYDEPVAAVPFFAKVRQAFQFGFGWLPTAAALASVAIVLGIGYFAFIGGKPDGPIARLNEQDNRVTTVQTPASIVPSIKDLSSDVTPVTSETGTKVAKAISVQTKTTHVPAKHNLIAPQPAKFADTNARRSNAPRLSNVSDEEDQTLRLSELLDVVDSSE
ncbi:MAG TPA: zf-HC2 domain-containing protein [Pyrinomonadaceae bacterium]|jgi:predicted anti-sigma-YlaC factor YlaD|nr:zf-HC2 domain-containing protein [Pyrinomonadaceae bacterium]